NLFLSIFICSFLIYPFFFLTVSAQTTDSVDVNLTVTGDGDDDDGGGGGGPPPPPPPEEVPGCTDSSALNFNPLANIDDGSCSYSEDEIPNVLNFTAVYNESAGLANLSWQNPSFPEFLRVRVVRKENSLPVDPFDGVLVYSGSGQSTTNNISFNVNYFYTAFVENQSNSFSSGAITSLFVAGDEEPPVPPPEEEPEGEEPEGGEPGGGDPIDPFESFPEVVSDDPLSSVLSISDFEFIQEGERPQIFKQNGIRLAGDKEIVIRLPYDKVPETLKTIGVSIIHPEDQNKIFSFLLKPDSQNRYYMAKIAPLSFSGQYPINIYVFNYQDQTIKRLSGTLVVAGISFSRSNTEAVVSDILVPLSV